MPTKRDSLSTVSFALTDVVVLNAEYLQISMGRAREGRVCPSRYNLIDPQRSCAKIKETVERLSLLSWRGREDLNLRGAFYTPYSLSRGAPSASWVLPQVDGDFSVGGESGIRTHGCSHIAGFQDRCLQPLGHLSVSWARPSLKRRTYLTIGKAGLSIRIDS